MKGYLKDNSFVTCTIKWKLSPIKFPVSLHLFYFQNRVKRCDFKNLKIMGLAGILIKNNMTNAHFSKNQVTSAQFGGVI